MSAIQPTKEVTVVKQPRFSSSCWYRLNDLCGPHVSLLDLPYDWCENPGKRRKRKHPKTSSSKSGVSFVEMSPMIASRWSELESVEWKPRSSAKM